MSPEVLSALDEKTGSGLDLLSRLPHFGHSYGFGFGASGPDRDVLTRLTSVLKVRECPYSRNGASLAVNNVDSAAFTGNGGYNTIGRQMRSRLLPHGFVRTAVAANAGTVDVGAPTDGSWATGQLVSVGIGTKAEHAYVTFVSGTSPNFTLSLDRNLVGGQAINEPVSVVPSEWEAQDPISLLWYGINDFSRAGMGSGGNSLTSVGERSFKEAYKAVVARLLCAEFFDANHASTSRSTNAATAAGAGYGIGAWLRALNINGNQVTIDVPSNFPGGDLYVFFTSNAGEGAVGSFTLDGAAHAPPVDLRNAHHSAASFNVFCKAFKDVSAGRHVIIVTAGSVVGNSYFNGWGVRATVPPVVVCPGVSRPANYKVWSPASSFPYARAERTVGVNHAIGTTTFTLLAPLDPNGNLMALKQGEIITFGEGTTNEESLTIAADVPAGALTTSTVLASTTTASTKAHNTGEVYVAHLHNRALLLRGTQFIPSVIAGYPDSSAAFPSSVIHVDVDALIGGQREMHGHDGGHLNDRGMGIVTEEIVRVLRRSPVVNRTLATRTSTPIAPLPSAIYFLGPLAVAAAGTAPGGAGAMAVAFANAEQRRDCRRAVIARLQLNVVASAPVGGKGKVEYSVDGGTTWKSLGRKWTWADTSNTVADTANPGNVDISTVGFKDSDWFLLPSEVLLALDVRFRYVHGNRTSGTNNPTYQQISLEFA